ncbi:MAG: hypothetical protein R3E79_16335 [Caldilineaceae bacterium]
MSVSGYFLIGRRLRRRPRDSAVHLVGLQRQVVLLLIGLPFAGESPGVAAAGRICCCWALRSGRNCWGTAFNLAIMIFRRRLSLSQFWGTNRLGALAFVIFQQPVQPLQLVGGAVLLTGIAATLAEQRTAQPVAAPA